MSLTTILPFTTPANYEYNTVTTDVTGGLAVLKDIRGADEIAYASFDTTANFDWSKFGTVPSPTVVGGSIANSRAEFDGVTAGSKAVFQDGGLITNPNVGAIRFIITPFWSGGSPSRQYIITSGDTTNNGRIQLFQAANGTIYYLVVYNESGTLVYSNSFSYSASAGTNYEVEINYDCPNGIIRMYANGATLLDGTFVGFTRTTNTLLTFGQDVFIANFAIDELVTFNVMKHTVPYTPGYSVSKTIYNINPQKITSVASYLTDGIASVSAVTTLGGAGNDILFTLTIAGQEMYWNGTIWATSNGTLAQLNSLTDINANLSSLDLSLGALFKVNAYLYSPLGFITPELDSITMVYQFFAATLSVPTSIVYGYVYDNLNPVSGAELQFTSDEPFFINGNSISVDEVTTTRSNGYFELVLPQTVSIAKRLDVNLKYVDARNKKQTRTMSIIVPALDAVELEDIIQ